MNRIKFITILCCMVLANAYTYAQEQHTETGILFRQGQSNIDPNFANNGQQLKDIIELLGSVCNNPDVEVRSITFCGSASPEGNSEINRKLSNSRLKALEAYVRELLVLPDELVFYNDHYIPWDKLAQSIEKSDMKYKDEVLDIIHKDLPDALDHQDNRIDGRIPVLKSLRGGKPWAILLRDHFQELRNACVVLVSYTHNGSQEQATALVTPAEQVVEQEVVSPVEEVVEQTITEPTTTLVAVNVPEPAAKEREPQYIYLKTNLVGLGALMANLAVEFDFGKHWSAQLPVYYSAWNYPVDGYKFRTLATQPEIRYWFWGNKQDLLFIGAHGTVAYYNFAFGGDERYQDKDGKTPAIGGGLSVGCRIPLCKNRRWKMEFSVGAGYYPLHYDIFQNITNGPLLRTEKKNYFGVDHAAISLSYTFNLKKHSK